jgi:hypothetical protein
VGRALLGFVGLIVVLAPSSAGAQEGQEGVRASQDIYQMKSVRVTERPEIDGDLSDAIWQSAAIIDGFVQQEPDEGAPATERTEVRLLYTESSLFLVQRFRSSVTYHQAAFWVG